MNSEPPTDDKGDGLPLYLQFASTLRTAIPRGVYPVGSRVPAEDELCRHFKGSRHTIREALRQLRSDGLITFAQGSRQVVAPLALPGQTDFFAGEGGFDYMLGTRLAIESMDMISVTGELAEEAGLPRGEQWLCVKGYRINVDDGLATCWNEYIIGAEYAIIGRILARQCRSGRAAARRPVQVEDRADHAVDERGFAVRRTGRGIQGRPRIAGTQNPHPLRNPRRPGGHRSLHPSGVFTYAIQRWAHSPCMGLAPTPTPTGSFPIPL